MSSGGERRLRILGRLAGESPVGEETMRLCQVCAEVTVMTGAGIMLMSGDIPQGSVCSTDGVSRLIEQLQYDLGEGPCVDAYRLNRPVLEPDLAEPVTPRWIAFQGPAVEAGALGVFGFPMTVGAARLGALNLYRDRAGPLSDEQHADALVMAEIAAQSVLLMQAGAPSGQLAAELTAGADFQYVVHQAAGMVSAQLEISVARALIRLRAHAFGNGRTVAEVAKDVVARSLRFDDIVGEDGATP